MHLLAMGWVHSWVGSGRVGSNLLDFAWVGLGPENKNDEMKASRAECNFPAIHQWPTFLFLFNNFPLFLNIYHNYLCQHSASHVTPWLYIISRPTVLFPVGTYAVCDVRTRAVHRRWSWLIIAMLKTREVYAR